MPIFKVSLVSWSCCNKILEPFKLISFNLFLFRAHKRLAWIGVISSLISLPYKLNPASTRRESRQPKPHKQAFLFLKIWLIKFSAFSLGIEISKPSSPVYPDLEIYKSVLSNWKILMSKKFTILERSKKKLKTE